MFNGIIFIAYSVVRLTYSPEKEMMMNTYKVVFAKNSVLTCTLLPTPIIIKGGYYYEQKKGQLIYAVITAPSEADALAVSGNILKEVTERTFGLDFIS